MTTQCAIEAILENPEQAQAVLRSQVPPFCREVWATGKRVLLTLQDEEDAKTVRQRNFYHKCVLKEIAEAAAPGGVKHDYKVWKEFFREKFLGSKWVVYKDPFTGKKYRRKIRVSTEDLGIRAYSKLIDEVSAFAATELGVTFSVRRWQDWRE